MNESEVEAWKKTEAEVLVLGFSKNDPIFKEAADTRAAYQKNVASDKWKMKWSGGLWKPSGIAQATPRSSADTAEIGKRFDDLSEVVALEIKTAREQADRQKEAERIERERDRSQEMLREQMREQQRIREAEEVLRESMRTPPADIPIARGVFVTNFVSMLPKVKDFTVASCRSPGQVPITEDITRPYENIHFIPPADDQEADRLSAGLGECERLLFRRLIEVIRLGKGRWITDQWMRDTARSYGPPAVSNGNGGAVSPPREPGETQSKHECFIDSNGIRACTVD